jgi:hypothetical protein
MNEWQERNLPQCRSVRHRFPMTCPSLEPGLPPELPHGQGVVCNAVALAFFSALTHNSAALLTQVLALPSPNLRNVQVVMRYLVGDGRIEHTNFPCLPALYITGSSLSLNFITPACRQFLLYHNKTTVARFQVH